MNNLLAEGQELLGVRIARTMDSQTYVLWVEGFYHRTYNLVLLDKDGFPVWNPAKMQFGSTTYLTGYDGMILKTDKNGDAIIVSSNLLSYEQSTNLFVYKIDKTGKPVWGDQGIEIKTALSWETRIALDFYSNNELLIADYSIFKDDRKGKIRLVRVGLDGSLIWGDEGILIGEENITYSYPQLSMQSNDECLLSYIREYGEYPYDRDIQANKIDGQGRLLWDKDIIVSNSPEIALSHFITSKTGPKGELILAWIEWPMIWMAVSKFQVINGYGNTWFWQGGIAASDDYNVNQFLPKIAGIREDGNLYVFFEQTDFHQGNRDLYGQCLAPGLGKLWGENAKKLIDSIPNRDLLATLVNDSIVIMFTQEYDEENDSTSILHLANITSQGELGWNPPILDLGSDDAEQLDLALSFSSTEESAVAWLDLTPSGYRRVKAQNFLTNGQIGKKTNSMNEVIVSNRHFVGYDPYNNKLFFENIIDQDRIIVTDMLGRVVLITEATNLVNLQLQSPGLYFVELIRNNQKLESNKFLVTQHIR